MLHEYRPDLSSRDTEPGHKEVYGSKLSWGTSLVHEHLVQIVVCGEEICCGFILIVSFVIIAFFFSSWGGP